MSLRLFALLFLGASLLWVVVRQKRIDDRHYVSLPEKSFLNDNYLCDIEDVERKGFGHKAFHCNIGTYPNGFGHKAFHYISSGEPK